MSGPERDDWTSATPTQATEQEQKTFADALVERLRRGDESALAELFDLFHERLFRLIDFRLDRSLHARVDPVDVLQDAYIDARQRLPHFFARQSSSISVWLRLIVLQRLQLTVRHHLLTDKRDARKEVSIDCGTKSQPIGDMAQILADSVTSASAVVVRNEALQMVEKMLNEMSETDREVLGMRHFEQLANEEVAEILGISVKAASNRYVRALTRLRDLVRALERSS